MLFRLMQERYRFDVMRLREHIKGRHLPERVTTTEYLPEVTCERGGVAGNIGDAAGTKGKKAARSPFLKPGSGRVQQQQVCGRM